MTLHDHDIVIRGGTIYDGTGNAGFVGDIAINGHSISAVGSVRGSGMEEIDATGKLITPGFVDIHTHYDGQATWDERLTPSSEHGVTTVVMGNCGVGFAPCRGEDHDRLISLMEGVEDIPNPVLAEGLSWNWESFSDFLNAIEEKPHDIDFACQVPHGPLRVYVMGQRGADREPANDEDIAEMARLTEEGIKAGALGFSTSRTLNHRTSEGDPTPCYQAAEIELAGIAKALENAGNGVLQIVSDFTDGQKELDLLQNLASSSGRPLILSMGQSAQSPDAWRNILQWIEAQNSNNVDVKGMVATRPVGILLGLDASMNPFTNNPAYKEIEHLPLPDRLLEMRKPEVKARILELEAQASDNPFSAILQNYNAMFILGKSPDYEQPREASLAAIAEREGTTAASQAYNAMVADDGSELLYTPFLNYADFDLEAVREMMLHPNTVLGLGDGGAHVGMICDGSFTTTLMTHWTRDRTRGEKVDLGWAVKAHCRDTAMAYGLSDRGLLKPGFKADINVIDHDNLMLHKPEIVRDLPAGGKRLQQRASGYQATIVSGVIIQRDGQPTGALPGKLVRGPQSIPMDVAAE